MTVITCQLDIIDNNNSSECTDEAGTDMSRVLQTGLMGRRTDSSDLMDQRLCSKCLFSLSPSVFLSYTFFTSSSVWFSFFALLAQSPSVVGSTTGLSAITSLFNWSINLINFFSLFLSLFRCQRGRSVTAPTVSVHWTVCTPPFPFTQSVSSTLGPFIIDQSRGRCMSVRPAAPFPSGIFEAIKSFSERFLERRMSRVVWLWALRGSCCLCEKWTSCPQYVTVRAWG